jgi:hypothetical protein
MAFDSSINKYEKEWSEAARIAVFVLVVMVAMIWIIR